MVSAIAVARLMNSGQGWNVVLTVVVESSWLVVVVNRRVVLIMIRSMRRWVRWSIVVISLVVVQLAHP